VMQGETACDAGRNCLLHSQGRFRETDRTVGVRAPAYPSAVHPGVFSTSSNSSCGRINIHFPTFAIVTVTVKSD
jgi:hypothetical protein